MSRSRSGSSSVFVLLFVVSVALNVALLSGCEIFNGIRGQKSNGQGREPTTKVQSSYDATTDLQEIAGKLGVAVEGSDAAEIANAIKTKIYVDATTKGIPRVVLTEEQFKIVTEQLPQDKSEIVSEYHKFIKSLEGKKIIVIP